jgi:hypothetical protein
MFKKGQKVRVEILEVHAGGELLVSFQGQLFRVKNTSGQRFQVGEHLLLVCIHTNPVEFSLAGEPGLFSRWI